MSTRKIKDAELDGEKVYFASHAKATYMSDGINVEMAMKGKQDVILKFTDVAASNWVVDNTYPEWPYRCDIPLTSVTSDDYAEIVLEADQASSGDYAPVCETRDGVVSLWGAVTDSIIIPTILITK